MTPSTLHEPSEHVRIVLPWGALVSSNERQRLGGGRGYWGHSRRYRESLDAIHLTSTAQLRASRVQLPAFPEGEVSVRMAFHPPDRRRRDETNFTKSLLDGLNGIAWKDDAQVADWHGTREAPDVKHPRVEIEVRRRVA